MLGQPGDFDASVKTTGIRGAFNISLWMFLPLVFVLMAALKFLPFTSIFADAIAGAATLGVSTGSYAPWAFFSYASLLLTVAIAYAGVRMLRAAEGESTAAG